MKYRLNKLLALFAALCLSSCLFSLGISASSDNGITASSTNLAPGSVFTLSVVIPEAADADNASIQVNFDSTAFEVVSWKPEIPNGVYNSGSDFFTVAAASSTRAIKLEEGLTLKAQMRVKEEAEKGLYKFNLTKCSLSFYDENIEDYVELWDPEVLTITVSVDPENEVEVETEEGEEIIEIDDDDDDGGDDEAGGDEGDAEIIEIDDENEASIDDDDDSDGMIIKGDEKEPEKPSNTTPSNGNKSPGTGVGIAVLIPAAVTGCVILAKKSPRKRFRPKSRKKSRKKKEVGAEASSDIAEMTADTEEEQ